MLPKFQSADPVGNKDFSLLQSTWSALIDPIIARMQNRSNLIPGVKLAVGSNTINHKLGRKLQGWKIVSIDAKAVPFDSQSSNQTPELTLILVSDAAANCTLEVF